MDFDSHLYRELFLTEAQEHLQRFNSALLALEREADNPTHLHECMRAIHTLKGMAATMGYSSVVTLAHGVEGFLMALRDRSLPITPEVTDRLLHSMDALDAVIRETGPARPKEATRSEATRAEAREPAGGGAHVRVRADHLDRLLNLVGALLTSGNRLQMTVPACDDAQAFQEALAEHRKTIAGLRDAVLQVRAQPVGQTFHRFPRMVRDLARSQGKQVECRLQGLDIELDRALLDRVTEALVHLLRNAVSHGIETPEERAAAGKPPRGTIRLTARQESGQAVITVEDDGRGVDVDRVVRRALELDLLGAPPAEPPSDAELLELICHPGFSSAASVDEAAGRGVGLDAVRRLVHEMGGRLDLRSLPGHGCTFILRLPLTLAILPAFVVQTGDGETYALPMASIDATMEIFPEHVEWNGPQPGVMHNLDWLPLYDLGALLGCGSAPLTRRRVAALVTVEGEQVAIVVGELARWEDIVVKPLPRVLQGISSLAGCTILSDGRVVLILDPVALLSARQALGATA
jgi:two-component system chemotaxis sensor kinase CheA